jgi:hypothetical protein
LVAQNVTLASDADDRTDVADKRHYPTKSVIASRPSTRTPMANAVRA